MGTGKIRHRNNPCTDILKDLGPDFITVGAGSSLNSVLDGFKSFQVQGSLHYFIVIVYNTFILLCSNYSIVIVTSTRN